MSTFTTLSNFSKYLAILYLLSKLQMIQRYARSMLYPDNRSIKGTVSFVNSAWSHKQITK